MTKEKVITICKKKEQELLNKCFRYLVKEAAIECLETVGPYTKYFLEEITGHHIKNKAFEDN